MGLGTCRDEQVVLGVALALGEGLVRVAVLDQLELPLLGGLVRGDMGRHRGDIGEIWVELPLLGGLVRLGVRVRVKGEGVVLCLGVGVGVKGWGLGLRGWGWLGLVGVGVRVRVGVKGWG